jgi:hypothetical protein
VEKAGENSRGDGPIVVFTHIPKTSGTSFRKALVEPNVPAELIYVYPGARRFLAQRRRPRAFIWGHVPYGVHAALRREVRYVTFLRDPIDRAVSFYHFAKDSDPREYVHPARADAEAYSLVDFFKLRRYQNWQARFIAGLSYHYVYPRIGSDAFDAEVGRRAVAHLRDEYVFGLQDRHEDSLELLERRLGWPRVADVDRYKQTATRPPLASLDEATVAALAESNHLDCELYRFAQATFEEQLGARP